MPSQACYLSYGTVCLACPPLHRHDSPQYQVLLYDEEKVEGQEVVTAIGAVDRGPGDKPLIDIAMQQVTIEQPVTSEE